MGGEIYALLQRLDEEIEPSGVTWEGPPRRRKRSRRWLRDYWPLLPLLGMVAVLLASDFYADANAFWLQHQVVSSIVTGFALSVAIIFGVERAIRARNRARWRPIGIRIAESFMHRTGMDELLTAVALEHCYRRYGEMEIPEGRNFFEVLPEALQEPESWRRDTHAPGLMDQADEELEALESLLTRWTPVLISEPDLATIGVAAMKLLDAIRQIRTALLTGHPLGGGPLRGPMGDILAPNKAAISRSAHASCCRPRFAQAGRRLQRWLSAATAISASSARCRRRAS